MYNGIVGQPASDHGRVLLVHALHQSFHALALEPGGLAACRLLHYFQKPVKSLLCLFLRHLVFHGRSRGACALGIEESEGIVKFYSADYVNGLIHILRCFPGKPHNNIRGDGHIRDLPADSQGKVQILLPGVAPVHSLQDPGGTGLQRKVQVAADFFGLFHHLYQFLRQVFGVGSHKTDALNPLYLLHFPQKSGKSDRTFSIPVRIDVLAQKHHFHHAFRCKLPNLPQNLFRLPAALPPSHIGHNAVAAEIVAAKHNVDTGFKRVLSVQGKIFYNLIRSLPDIQDHPLRSKACPQQLGKLENIVGAKDQIHKGITFFQLFNHRFLLHHAAAESNLHTRSAPFQSIQLPKPSIDALICVVPHCAGVENDKIRILVFRGQKSCLP